MENKDQPPAAALENPENPDKPEGRTSWKRVVLILFIGGLLAAGVYAYPKYFVKQEEPKPKYTHLKTGGTGVMSVMVENRWKAKYLENKQVQIDYESTGSTAGVEKMIQKQLAIAFTHAPLTADQRAKAKAAGGELVQIPIVICSVVPVYNLPELKGKEKVKFTGDILADIFLGNIRKWNDKPLKDLNGKLELPATDITVVHRKDSSGTTQIFSNYLSKTSDKWRKQFPQGGASEITWPVGNGATRNLNLAIEVSRTPGAIGYIDLMYTFWPEFSELEHGSIQNHDKTAFVRAEGPSMTAAAKGAITEIQDDLTFDVADKKGDKAYPISGVIYAVCYEKQPEETRALVADFLKWATHDGQQFTEKMSYAPLPQELVEKVDNRLKVVQ